MDPEDLELSYDPMLGAGTWSNLTRVVVGPEQVTIDFIVIDPVEPGSGFVAARVALTPGAAFKLRDTLVEQLGRYTGDNPPRE